MRTGGGEELTFQTLLRILPRQRYSGFARWRGRGVFAKLFIGRRARVHFEREARGLRALIEAEIATPILLHSGRVKGGYVVICERINDANTCNEVWGRAPNDDARLELLRQLTTVVAAHHNAGVRQRDLHLNNFLAANEKIYTLDGAGIVSGKISKAAALDNLALLLAQVHSRFDAHAGSLYSDYSKKRDWTVEAAEIEYLHTQIGKIRPLRLGEYLDKIFRECSAFKCEKTFRSFTVYDRSYDSPALCELVADPDSAFAGALLKKGNTSTVAKITVDSRELVFKRYNIKGLWHGINRAPRRTRAARSWENAHRLRFHEIATARPIALIERRYGPLRSTSFFVAEYVPGPNVGEFLAATPDRRQEVVQKTAELLCALKSLRLSHGDMKATNIIIRDGEPVLLDLDAMRVHRSQASLRRAIGRDARRLLANWEPGSGIYQGLNSKLRKLLA